MRLLGGRTLWRSRKDAICHRLEEMDGPVLSPACVLLVVVIYLHLVEDDEDDEDDEDNEDPLDEDDENPLHEAIIAQRMRLSEEEVCNLWDIIPPRADFVGVPFVTLLTSAMVDQHDMVSYTY